MKRYFNFGGFDELGVLKILGFCTKIFYKTKKRWSSKLELTVIELDGMSDKRWLQKLIATRNWKVTGGARTIPLRMADRNP